MISGIQEISSEAKNKGPEHETEARTLKTMLLSLKAQSSVAKASAAEVRQLNGKQIELLEKLVNGFQAQTDHLQNISDDLGQNWAVDSRSWLRYCVKDLHSRQRLDHQEVEARNQKIMEKMDGQNEIFKHVRKGINGINDSLKNTNWTLEEIRSGGAKGLSGKVGPKGGSLLATINKNITSLMELQPEVFAGLATEIRSIMETTVEKVSSELKESIAGQKKRSIDPKLPETVKKVKDFHPTSGKEFETTEQEREINMAKWFKEIQHGSAPAGVTPTTPAEPAFASAPSAICSKYGSKDGYLSCDSIWICSISGATSGATTYDSTTYDCTISSYGNSTNWTNYLKSMI